MFAFQGIPSIAFEPNVDWRTDVVTPYGIYTLALSNVSVALQWYHNMLIGPRMQGPYGSTESVNRNGTEICPLTTWDSKITRCPIKQIPFAYDNDDDGDDDVIVDGDDDDICLACSH